MTTIAHVKKGKNNSQILKSIQTKTPSQDHIVAKHVDKNRSVLSIFPKGIYLAQTEEDLSRVRAFKKNYCQDDRPGVCEFHNDGFDDEAYVFYGTDRDNNIVSTARLLLDSEKGFPEEEIFPQSVSSMRREGKKIAELGRLLIIDDNLKQFKFLYKAIDGVADQNDIDVILIVMKQKHIPSHKKMMEINVLSMDMGLSWDEEQAELCLVAWDMKAPQPKFYKWIGGKATGFSRKLWGHYSPFHLGAMVSVQHEVYQCIATKMHGNVLDLGCGSGRIMGYLQENHDVDSYTGVDSSKDMIKQASWLKEQLGFSDAKLIHCGIEDIKGQYESILSTHSFYSWPKPERVLSHVSNLLAPSGIFVLVTPNNNFDVEKLSRMVRRELLGHPYYEEFLSINYAIAEKAKAKNLYGSIDELIGQVRRSGFHVKVAHSDFFLGGASYLELTKGS